MYARLRTSKKRESALKVGRDGERGMQTGHAVTKEERMFRETENSSERSRREKQRREQEL